MRKSPSNEEIEKNLSGLFPQPDTAFLNQLEDRLLRQAHNSANTVHPAPRPRVRNWAFAAVGLVLALVLISAAIWPQRALAAVQKLVSYLPGIGFVEQPNQPLRVLASQVEASKGGVTVIVEKGLVDAQSTQIRIRVDGVPQDKALFEEGWMRQSAPELRLPDGQRLACPSSISGAGDYIWAEYSCAPLPAGVEDAGLLLPAVPGVKAGVAPENWEIPMHFEVAKEGDGLISTTQDTLASEPVNRARLIITSMAAAGDTTALNVSLESEDPAWKPDSGWWKGLTLVDEQGNQLPLEREQSLGLGDHFEQVLLAPALQSGARYSLRLQNSDWEVSLGKTAPPAALHLQLPDPASAGQSWATGEVVQAAGYNLQFTGAALTSGVNGGLVLELSADPVAGILGFSLTCKEYEICHSSGFELAQPGQPLLTQVFLEQAPGRTIDLEVERLFVQLTGLWEVSFQAP